MNNNKIIITISNSLIQLTLIAQQECLVDVQTPLQQMNSTREEVRKNSG